MFLQWPDAVRFWVFDVALPALSVVAYATYHIWMYRYRAFEAPTTTSSGVNQAAREQFWDVILTDPDKHAVRAIQSLRNFNQGAIFFASTSLIITTTSAGFGMRLEDPELRFKLMFVAGCGFVAYLNFVQTVRFGMHLTFLFQVRGPRSALS